jgi:hypothetical protein
MSKTLLWILGTLMGLVLLFWLGTRITPSPFSAFPIPSGPFTTIPLPEDLPVPVERYYRVVYGEQVPVIESFILTGRGKLRFQGITLPARWRFSHQSGKNYRHYIETTLWGIPILKVNEHFIDGNSRLELPFGVVENEPQVDQAANLGLWSETMMFSAVYLTVPGVRWEAIDAQTARLVVPFKDEEDVFTVYFNPQTGLIETMEALRWKEAGDLEKTLWQAQAIEWGEIQGWKAPTIFAAQWMDDDSPWLVAQVKEVVWNVDLADYIKEMGE